MNYGLDELKFELVWVQLSGVIFCIFSKILEMCMELRKTDETENYVFDTIFIVSLFAFCYDWCILIFR